MPKLTVILRVFSIVLLAVSGLSATGKEKSDKLKPRWITSSLPQPKSPGYIFISAQGSGATLDEARQRALVNLTTKLEHERGIEVSTNLSVSKQTNRTSGSRTSATTQTFELICTEKGKEITLVSRLIDEYWERANDGTYTVTDLFTVNDQASKAGGSYCDNIKLTTSYGFRPVVYSLIPGVGQIYKGSALKGGLILGGAAVCTAGIVTMQSLYSSYVNKRVEYPQHFDFYNKKVTDTRNIRNVIIGVGGALYVYNLIDAAVAPGRRRVKITRNQTASYTLTPTISTVPGSDSEIAPMIALSINF